MFEGCGTSFYLPDSYCTFPSYIEPCVGVHSVPFRSHSHLMSAGVLIYNSASSMLLAEQQHRGCQNNLIHSVWASFLLLKRLDTTFKLSWRQISLTQEETSWCRKRNDGVWSAICQGLCAERLYMYVTALNYPDWVGYLYSTAKSWVNRIATWLRLDM